MSFAGTYAHSVLIGLDDLGAGVFFNRNDITISSLCRLSQLGQLGPLKLAAWQIVFLKILAPTLDRIQPNHCELARQGDIARAQSMIALLSQP